MDYVTHIVTGAAGYKLIGSGVSKENHYLKDRLTLTARGLFFLGSILPDIDNISRLWGIEAYIVHHRGITHSIPFALCISLAVALLSAKFLGLASFSIVFLAMFLAVIFHIYMDLITSYGTQVFLPFTNTRFSLDWVFIVDPIYTLVIFIIFLLASIRNESLKLISKIALPWTLVLWIFFYPLVCGVVKHLISVNLAKSMQPHHLQFHILPDLGTPFFWKLIARDHSSYRVASVNVISQSITFDAREFEALDENFAKRVSEKIHPFGIYKWFAVYPYQKLREDDNGGKILEIGDLRFFSPLRILQERRPVPPFTVFLQIDKSGIPTSLSYEFP